MDGERGGREREGDKSEKGERERKITDYLSKEVGGGGGEETIVCMLVPYNACQQPSIDAQGVYVWVCLCVYSI